MFRGPGYPITSVGLVNCLGFDKESIWRRLLGQQGGLTTRRLFEDFCAYETVVGAVDLPAAESKLTADRRARQARLALAALDQVASDVARACQRWGSQRVGLVLGTSTGGIAASERAYAAYRERKAIPDDYSFEKQHAFDGAARLLAGELGIEGPTYVVSTACSSSAKAAAAAGRLLETHVCDAVLVGGVDSLCLTTLMGFRSLGVVASGPCRPFAEGRDGITIGEGAALLLVERTGAAEVFLASVGETGDAHHMAHPHPDGVGAEQAMRQALGSAGMSPNDVDYINAHGTGTFLNDDIETAAIRRMFGAAPAVSSTKAYTGHLLGACGATEVAFCAAAIEAHVVPGNGPSEPAAGLGIAIPKLTSSRPIQVALSNSLAFGGSNASVLLASRAGLERGRAQVERGPRELSAAVVQAWSWAELESKGDGGARSRLLAPRARGRASALTLMFIDLVEKLVEGGFDAAGSPIVFGSAYGEMATTMQLLEQQAESGHSSPLRFQLSVHNTAAGLLSIATGNRGFCNSIAAGTQTFAMALLEAIVYLEHSDAEEVGVVVADEASVSALSSQRHGPVAAGFHLRRREAVPISQRWLVRAPRRWTGSPEPQRSYATDPLVLQNPIADALKLCQAFAEKSSGRLVLADRDAGKLPSSAMTWWVTDVGA